MFLFPSFLLLLCCFFFGVLFLIFEHVAGSFCVFPNARFQGNLFPVPQHMEQLRLLWTAQGPETQSRCSSSRGSLHASSLLQNNFPDRIPRAMLPTRHGWRPHTHPLPEKNFLGRLWTAGFSEAVWFQRCCSAVVFSGPCRQTNFLEGITPAGESPEAAAVYTVGSMLQLCGRCPGSGRLFRLCFVSVTYIARRHARGGLRRLKYADCFSVPRHCALSRRDGLVPLLWQGEAKQCQVC